jgi:hypothetical protein
MSTSTFSYAIYAVIAASWVAWGAFTRIARPRYATLGGIVRRMMRNPVMAWAVWASWAFVGWHLFVRGRGAFK